jgi:phospho-N-acetylmuramoyl-pentapeptide-transferase
MMPPLVFLFAASTPLIVVLAGAIVSFVVTPWLIFRQRRGGLGQHIYEDAPSSHAMKQGTPTGGGVAFAVAALVGYALSGFGASELPLVCLVLAAAAVGLLDDTLIVRARRALGLRARAKFMLLAVIAVAYVGWISHLGAAGREQLWFGATFWLPPWLWFALAVLAVVGAANAVNLTDGLDGLSAGAVIPTLIALQLTAEYSGGRGGWTVADAMLGSALGFLWFNRYPARIFMGDVGSLALGALIAGVAIQSRALLLLPLFGIVFVLEALSVMLQVVSFKSTGKRIFKMSPLHHHFELSGWREAAISSTFVVFQTIAAGATWIGWWSSSAWAVRPQ